jgi:sortase A
MATRVRPRVRRRPLRAVLHFVATVLVTSGLLLLADAGLTIVWQEPVSAFLANIEQNKLDDELDAEAKLAARDLRELAGERDVSIRMEKLAERAQRRARPGHAMGKIEIPKLDKSYAVVEGVDLDDLRKGPGHYSDTEFPGEKGTTAVAGHRTTYGAPFRQIDELKPGDEVIAKMPYGRFIYRVERTQIVASTAYWVTDRARPDGPVIRAKRLVLTACHPLYSAAKRIVAFARLDRIEPV